MCAGGAPRVRLCGASSGDTRSNRVKTDAVGVGEVVSMYGVWWFSGFKAFSAVVGDDIALGVSRVHVAVAREPTTPEGRSVLRAIFAAGEALLPPPHPICPRPGARTSASRRACAQILRYRHPGASGDWLPGCGAPAARQTLEPTATLVLFSLNIRHFLANALVRARGHPTFHVFVEEPRCLCS